MATVVKDSLSDLSCSEQGGVVVELRRSVLIQGLTPGTAPAVCYDALAALDAEDLKAQSSPADHPGLVLMSRNVRLTEPTRATVELLYRHFAENEYQDLASPPGGFLIYQRDAGVAERTSQVDEAGDPIILGYTYSTSATVEPSAYKSCTTLQGGEVSVRIPTKTMHLSGTLADVPGDDVVDGILGKVNDADWQGGAARSWMCTRATWKPWNYDNANRGPAGRGEINMFQFDFEYNPDGWDPQAVFVHEASGRPVQDWKTNAGYSGKASYAVVKWSGEEDFDGYFRDLGVEPA